MPKRKSWFNVYENKIQRCARGPTPFYLPILSQAGVSANPARCLNRSLAPAVVPNVWSRTVVA